MSNSVLLKKGIESMIPKKAQYPGHNPKRVTVVERKISESDLEANNILITEDNCIINNGTRILSE